MHYSYTIVEYDPGQPWVVIATRCDVVELGDDEDFGAWARERWAEPRFRVDLDPELKPWDR